MSLPWYRWFPSDFYGEALVQMMSASSRGAYRELLDQSWMLGPLRDPEATLIALGWDPELWNQIAAAWESNDEGWTQPRLEKERKAAKKRHQSAKKAVLAREKARKARSSADNRPIIQPEPEPEPEPDSLKNPPTPRGGKAPPAPFDWRESLRAHDRLWSEEVVKALEEYLACRRENRFPTWKPTTWKKNLKLWTTWGPERLVEALENSIRGGWRSVNEPRGNGHGSKPADEELPPCYKPFPREPQPPDNPE